MADRIAQRQTISGYVRRDGRVVKPYRGTRHKLSPEAQRRRAQLAGGLLCAGAVGLAFSPALAVVGVGVAGGALLSRWSRQDGHVQRGMKAAAVEVGQAGGVLGRFAADARADWQAKREQRRASNETVALTDHERETDDGTALLMRDCAARAHFAGVGPEKLAGLTVEQAQGLARYAAEAEAAAADLDPSQRAERARAIAARLADAIVAAEREAGCAADFYRRAWRAPAPAWLSASVSGGVWQRSSATRTGQPPPSTLEATADLLALGETTAAAGNSAGKNIVDALYDLLFMRADAGARAGGDVGAGSGVGQHSARTT